MAGRFIHRHWTAVVLRSGTEVSAGDDTLQPNWVRHVCTARAFQVIPDQAPWAGMSPGRIFHFSVWGQMVKSDTKCVDKLPPSASRRLAFTVAHRQLIRFALA